MKTKANKPAKSNIAKMAIVGVLSAIAYLLMFMEFSVPLMPVFIKTVPVPPLSIPDAGY